MMQATIKYNLNFTLNGEPVAVEIEAPAGSPPNAGLEGRHVGKLGQLHFVRRCGHGHLRRSGL